MKTKSNKLNIVSFTLAGFAETVWDIGTKITAARLMLYRTNITQV